MIKEAIQLLGLRAEDKISGASGVIDSVCFDLYGCLQVSLAGNVKPDGDVPASRWYDVHRMEVTDTRVMPVPDFDASGSDPSAFKHGPAAKAPR